MNNQKDQSTDQTPDSGKPAPFTQDEKIVKKIGNTTYIFTAKYKQDATEGLADKLLRLFQNAAENDNY